MNKCDAIQAPKIQRIQLILVSEPRARDKMINNNNNKVLKRLAREYWKNQEGFFLVFGI